MYPRHVAKPRASGATQTNEQRRDAGKVRLSMWLDEDVAERLEELARMSERTKRDVIHDLIRKVQ